MSGPGYCFDCGDELDEGESICDACGEAFMADAEDESSDEFCLECGSDDLEDGICNSCGSDDGGPVF